MAGQHRRAEGEVRRGAENIRPPPVPLQPVPAQHLLWIQRSQQYSPVQCGHSVKRTKVRIQFLLHFIFFNWLVLFQIVLICRTTNVCEGAHSRLKKTAPHKHAPSREWLNWRRRTAGVDMVQKFSFRCSCKTAPTFRTTWFRRRTAQWESGHSSSMRSTPTCDWRASTSSSAWPSSIRWRRTRSDIWSQRPAPNPNPRPHQICTRFFALPLQKDLFNSSMQALRRAAHSAGHKYGPITDSNARYLLMIEILGIFLRFFFKNDPIFVLFKFTCTLGDVAI